MATKTKPIVLNGTSVKMAITSEPRPESLICDVEIQNGTNGFTLSLGRQVVEMLYTDGTIHDRDVFVWVYGEDGTIDDQWCWRFYENTHRKYGWRKNVDGTTSFR